MVKAKYIFLIALGVVIFCGGFYFKRHFKSVQTTNLTHKIQNGDIIFHTSLSEQSKAIQVATNSKYSHCGIIYRQGKEWLVFEAVQPVKLTPLTNWIARGKDKHYVIKRLKNATQILTPDKLATMQTIGKKYMGKNYDLYFEWSDDKIYCSELIWKVYKQATGLEVGRLEQLKDFDLSNKVVQQKMKERYGKNIPYQENVISPKSIFNSDLLETIVSR